MSACPKVAWTGRITSRRGRAANYRVVVNHPVPTPEEIVRLGINSRRLFTVERCSKDAMGDLCWSDCTHSPPKSVILAMAIKISGLTGGAA